MPAHIRSAICLTVFAVAVIIGGIIRFYSGPGGDKGLYFGLVMGGLLLLAALFAYLSKLLPAKIIGAIAIAFVVLWFAFELTKGWTTAFTFGEPEIRKLITMGLGVFTATVLFRREVGKAS